jgi:hypothetical protein
MFRLVGHDWAAHWPSARLLAKLIPYGRMAPAVFDMSAI